MLRTHLTLTDLEDRSTPATLPTGFTEAAVATGLTQASALAAVPDGRVFVAEQKGDIRVVKTGQLLPTPLLTLTVDSTGERGLNGVALDPNFAANGFVYVYYTVPGANGAAPFNRVSRFTVAGDAVVPGSESVLVNLDPLGATNHNGGALGFGGDGKLYVGVGENGVPANAQSIANRFGKLLRLNPDGSIPADNPATFPGITGSTTGANRAIWAVGLRNPYTLAVRPSTGEIAINDVGQSQFEEVNRGQAGANYGWPTTEGRFDQAAFPNLTEPIVTYGHGTPSVNTGVAIVGGSFYEPNSFPATYSGSYFFLDYTGRYINRVDPATGAVSNFASDLTPTQTIGLAEAANGDLLYLGFGSTAGSGALYKISYTAAAVPPVPPVPPGLPPVTPPVTPPVVPPVAPPVTPPTVPPATPPVPPSAITVLGAGAGGGPAVVVVDAATGAEVGRFFAFEPTFTGGVSVASANLTADGVPDLIVGAGAGGGPRVRVFDGATRAVLRDFFAFEPTFTGGVNVAAGDVNGDGTADLIVTAELGGGPRVRVFDGKTGGTLADFFAFETTFTGGTRAAVGDLNGDGVADLVVTAGPGGGPRVAKFDGRTLGLPTPTRLGGDFFAFDPAARVGSFVALSDFDGDGTPDLVVTPGPGGGPLVRVLSGRTNAPIAEFFAGDAATRDGLTVAARGNEITLAPGKGGTASVYLVQGASVAKLRDLPGFPGFNGAIDVG